MPPEAVQFRRVVDCLLTNILLADPVLRPVFLSKVVLTGVYIYTGVRMEDMPRLAVVVPPMQGGAKPLIGFHLSLPMGYVESTCFSVQQQRPLPTWSTCRGSAQPWPHPTPSRALQTHLWPMTQTWGHRGSLMQTSMPSSRHCATGCPQQRRGNYGNMLTHTLTVFAACAKGDHRCGTILIGTCSTQLTMCSGPTTTLTRGFRRS